MARARDAAAAATKGVGRAWIATARRPDCIWVRGKCLGDNVEEGARAFKKVSHKGSKFRMKEWCFFFGQKFAKLKWLWKELKERIVYRLKAFPKSPIPRKRPSRSVSSYAACSARSMPPSNPSTF